MRNTLIFALCACLLASPIRAQDAPPATLMDKLDEMMQLFRDRVAPKMEEGLQAMEPELRDFMARMQGMVQYHAPEVLPNGDILIRRKAPEDGAPEDGAPDHLPDNAPSSPPVTTPFEL
jgi:hypothetical protein